MRLLYQWRDMHCFHKGPRVITYLLSADVCPLSRTARLLVLLKLLPFRTYSGQAACLTICTTDLLSLAVRYIGD